MLSVNLQTGAKRATADLIRRDLFIRDQLRDPLSDNLILGVSARRPRASRPAQLLLDVVDVSQGAPNPKKIRNPRVASSRLLLGSQRQFWSRGVQAVA
jgi:hypothetical protein